MGEDAPYVPVDATCLLCGGTFAKRGLTRHLKSCRDKHPSQTEAPAERILHLLVEGQDAPDYYLHVEVPARLTYADLDAFLRAIWLECCGHLSGFRFAADARPRLPAVDFGDDAAIDAWIEQAARRMFAAASGDDDDRIFREKLGKRLQVGSSFEHDYDYGTTTTLSLRVIADGVTVPRGNGVYAMARNNPPEIACEECGEPAAWICTECMWDGWGTLCERCAPKHECGEEMLLPLVNSPRTGMCAYDGPATWENQPVVQPARAKGVARLPRTKRRR